MKMWPPQRHLVELAIKVCLGPRASCHTFFQCSQVASGAAASSPSRPCSYHGVEGPWSPGERRKGWKGGEVGSVFLPWGGDGLPSK